MCFVNCFSGILTNAQALDVNTLFTALKSELGNKVVAANDINAAEQPIKKMLGMGASLAEVKSVLLDFIGKGFKGNNLSSLVSCVSDLMKKGTSVEMSEQIIRNVSQIGVKVYLAWIVGFPGEEEKDFNETVQFINRNKEYIIAVIFRIIKSTACIRIVADFGLISFQVAENTERTKIFEFTTLTAIISINCW